MPVLCASNVFGIGNAAVLLHSHFLSFQGQGSMLTFWP
jgi:hypothetical protein